MVPRPRRPGAALAPRGSRPSFQEVEVVEPEPRPSLRERVEADGLWAVLRRFVAGIPAWAREQLVEFVKTHPYAAALAVWGFIRALGVTIQSGQQGLKFSFGRATKVLEPGLHLMVPFVQIAKVAPNRSRTIDLEDQQVATLDGLVYRVHATLVWRIVDIRKALIEIDELEVGMRNALALSVWTVLKDRERGTVRGSEELDAELAARMEERLEPWGVVVERAGFQSIAPMGQTLDLLQLRSRVGERERVARALACGLLGGGSTPPGASVGLVGTPRFPVRRQVRATWRAAINRRRRILTRETRKFRATQAK